MVDIALWVISGLGIAYIAARLGISWLAPQVHE